MSPWIMLPLIALISYLLGSLNTSIIYSRCKLRKDIRNYGSGNAGFTNAVRAMGWKKAMIVLAGDVCKCAAAIIIGQLIYSGDMSFDGGAQGRLIAGAGVFLGHIYPLYFGFRGGKGVLTLGVTMLMFDWRIFCIAFSVFLIIAFATHYISLGSVIASFVLPILVFWFHQMAIGYTVLAAFMTAVVIIKHRANIVRLIHGKESRFSFRGKALMDSTSDM